MIIFETLPENTSASISAGAFSTMTLNLQKIHSTVGVFMKQAISVSELTRAIQVVLEQSIGGVAVSGEISNFKEHTSGHRYFTLKDAGAQIQCVMWKSRPLTFRPVDGMKVVVRGRVTIYPQRGNYQVDCTSMQPLGKGDLQLAFEALKQKLFEEGLFAPEHKRALPELPGKIGIVTSPTGAAVQDILTTLQRRMPSCEILLRPTLVQGVGSSEDIVRAIEELNRTDCDVLIVGRGGGSIEDLWAFNTEEVARAIFRSRIPIISAVGHEVDITIADFVADARAATPTAAAEIAARDYRELLAALNGLHTHMTRLLVQKTEMYQRQLRTLAAHPSFRYPTDRIRQYQQEVDYLETSLHRSASRSVSDAGKKLKAMAAHLASVHPLSPLRRGFALLRSEETIIGPAFSLRDFSHIEIVRHAETAEAVISAVFNSSPFTGTSHGKNTETKSDV